MPLPRWPFSAVLGAASLGCSDTKPFRSFSWEERDRKAAVFLSFDSASANSFSAADGRPCRAATRFNVLGWESNPDREQPACTHDTLQDGVGTASLDLRFRGTIPGNGD